jgi:hypothetical protein
MRHQRRKTSTPTVGSAVDMDLGLGWLCGGGPMRRQRRSNTSIIAKHTRCHPIDGNFDFARSIDYYYSFARSIDRNRSSTYQGRELFDLYRLRPDFNQRFGHARHSS